MSAPPPITSKDVILAMVLLVGMTAFYMLWHPVRPLTVDSKVTLDTVRAMAVGQLEVPAAMVTRSGRDGRHYSLYNPLLPALALPGYVVGCRLQGRWSAPGEASIGWGDYLALATNQWITALAVAVLFLLGRAYRQPTKTSLGLACLAGVSTMLLPYSRDFFSQPLAASCLLLSASGILCYRQYRQFGWLYLASSAAALALLTRTDMVVCLPWLVVWAGVESAVARWQGWSRSKALLLAIPLMAAVLLLVGLDWWRWGGLTVSHYQSIGFNMPWIDSVPRFFFSTELSVALFNPLLIVSWLMMIRAFHQQRGLVIAVWLVNLSYLLLVASYCDYHGGICPGPRYLLALVPLNLAGMMVSSGDWTQRNHSPLWQRCSFYCVLATAGLIGLLMNGYYLFVDYSNALPAWQFYSASITSWFGVR